MIHLTSEWTASVSLCSAGHMLDVLVWSVWLSQELQERFLRSQSGLTRCQEKCSNVKRMNFTGTFLLCLCPAVPRNSTSDNLNNAVFIVLTYVYYRYRTKLPWKIYRWNSVHKRVFYWPLIKYKADRQCSFFLDRSHLRHTCTTCSNKPQPTQHFNNPVYFSWLHNNIKSLQTFYF